VVQLLEPCPGGAGACEVEPADLLGREDAVLVAVERDQTVALGQP